MRASVGLYTDIPGDWFSGRSKAFATGSLDPARSQQSSIQACCQWNSLCGFQGLIKGAGSRSSPFLLHRCDATQGSKAKILVPNIDLVKGEEYETKFNYRFKDGDLGILWSPIP